MKTSANEAAPKNLDRALDLLNLLATNSNPMNVMEISKALDVTRTTAYAMLGSLSKKKLVVHTVLLSKVAFNQTIDSIRAGGTVVAVGLPSEYMELLIVKTVLDGIRVVRSLVGTRKDLEEAFDFGAQGLVVPVVETVPVDTAVEVFDQMGKDEIQGRKVLDFTK